MPTITNSITIGSAAYPSPFTLAGSVTVMPTLHGAYGITLAPGASLTNKGFVEGASYGGAGITLYSGAILNSGTVEGGAGNAQGNSYTTNGGYGIEVSASYGGPATINNTGTVLGGAGGADVSAGRYSAAGYGVFLYGQGTTLINSGLVRGGAGGAIQAGATAAGGGGGVGVKVESYAVIVNKGTIAGGSGGAGTQGGAGGYGVFLESHGTVINTGTILGGNPGFGTAANGGGAGVYLRNGVLINAGTITAAATANSSGIRYAVRFGVIDAATLVVEQGAMFNGAVYANGIQQDLLELGGTAAVNLSGIGTQFKYFNEISFANGARDVIAGNSYGLANGNTISGFTNHDTIILDGFAASTKTVASGSFLTLGSGTLFETIDIGGTFAASDFTISAQGGNTTITTDVLCFCRGTRIATPGGAIAVERLRIGDMVSTLHGPPVKVRWVGRRSYAARFINENHLGRPVHFAKGALAPGVPARMLAVSPGHGIWIDGALVPAWRLINDVTITQPECDGIVDYFHIETEAHDVILAENCPVESLLAIGMRGLFQNAEEYDLLYPAPELAPAPLPRVEAGFHLAAIQRRTAKRAGIIPPPAAGCGPLLGYIDQSGPWGVSGWAQDARAPEAPVCLDIYCDDRRIGRVLANGYRADLRAAKVGSGCNAFIWTAAGPISGVVTVRRSAGGPRLPDYSGAAKIFAAF